jgi:hypothetical protein
MKGSIMKKENKNKVSKILCIVLCAVAFVGHAQDMAIEGSLLKQTEALIKVDEPANW